MLVNVQGVLGNSDQFNHVSIYIQCNKEMEQRLHSEFVSDNN